MVTSVTFRTSVCARRIRGWVAVDQGRTRRVTRKALDEVAAFFGEGSTSCQEYLWCFFVARIDLTPNKDSNSDAAVGNRRRRRLGI
jgi:hypothetical protein